MFDSNNDSTNGTSIWGHTLDGAASGAIGGSVVLPFLGTVAGGVGGGFVGLANGLYESYEEDSAFDALWDDLKMPDDDTVERLTEQADAMAGDKTMQGLSDEDRVKEAMRRVFLQDNAAKEQQETSWFNDLF